MAVYTEVSDEDLSAFLADYELGAVLTCKGIAEGVSNTNYALRTERGLYILTLYEQRVDAAELPFFMDLMRHLSERGFTCPTPVARRDGNVLGAIRGRPAALVSFLDGIAIRRPGAEHCFQLGRALAGLHDAARDFSGRRSNALAVPGWRPLYEQADGHADRVKDGLDAVIREELALHEAGWPDDLPVGTIHADLFPDNAFFLRGEVSGVIDFYFACTDLLAYDVAICLNAWCFEADQAFNVTKAQALLRGYSEVRALSTEEIAALPQLCRGAALRFLLTRLVDWLNVPPGALVRPKDPLEYARKLRFHQSVASAAEYGIAA